MSSLILPILIYSVVIFLELNSHPRGRRIEGFFADKVNVFFLGMMAGTVFHKMVSLVLGE